MRPELELPIDAHLPDLLNRLKEHRAVVLVAEPGAGKTTRVPPAILRSGLLSRQHPNIIMLQPRRIAARAAAGRIADENGWAVGQEVGYQVRFENRICAKTRVRIVTEAILTRQIFNDPSLEGVGCVILDEFHERSIHSDLALAFLKEIKHSLRDDLLIVVMSATLDAQPVSQFLDRAPIINVPGRLFPVDISHRPCSGQKLEEAIGDVVSELPDDGNVLVFLPGANEINYARFTLVEQMRFSNVVMLHGSLSFEEQQRAIAPGSGRKIILATNIAETSLTIDGVRTVIDSGLVRKPTFDTQRGLDVLNLERISRASATQRAGRAGRTAAGRCIRLWTPQEHETLAAFDISEIKRVDITGTLLDLHAWGESDPRKFGWYESPPEDSINRAETLLKMLGALDANGKLTEAGRTMQMLPMHPRLARLLIASSDAKLGATVAAILSEKDFLLRLRTTRGEIGSKHIISQSDVELRVNLIDDRQGTASALQNRDVDRAVLQQVRQGCDQYLRLTTRSDRSVLQVSDLRQLVLLAYPDRVCRRRVDVTRGVMVGGVGVRLDEECSVRSGEYFVAVDARQDDRNRNREAVVRIASSIEEGWLEQMFPQSISKQRVVEYDVDRKRVVARVRTNYLDLVLRENIDPNVTPQEASDLLAMTLRADISQLIEADERLENLVGRVRFLSHHLPDHGFPMLDEAFWDQLLSIAAAGRQTRSQVVEALYDTLKNQMVYPLDRLLAAQAPETIEVPTGSQIRLKYHSDPAYPPVLAVRLQEMFGMRETPRVAEGRVAVMLHLLGPNYRPVQVTQDLASFWKNTYAQVRKDLRGQYPKHSWPDDPLTAEAIRGAKRRRGS